MFIHVHTCYFLLFPTAYTVMYIKNPFEANLLQREFHEFAFIKPMDIDHLLRYMAQTRKELIFPIVSTEGESYNL